MQRSQKLGYSGVFPSRVVVIGQLRAIGIELETISVELPGNFGKPLFEIQNELFFAELSHQLVLLLDQDDFAVVDDADTVGKLLGFLDVMRRQDDRHARLAQGPDDIPKVLAKLYVHAGGWLIEEQNVGLVRQRLRDEITPLHATRQHQDFLVFLVPERQ